MMGCGVLGIDVHGQPDIEVTDVSINFVTPDRGLFCYAKITLNGCIVMRGIGIHKKLNSEELRLTFPTKAIGGEQAYIAHPVTKEASKIIEDAIFDKVAIEQEMRTV